MLAPGAVVLALAGTKTRATCIVLRIRPDGNVVLIYGTGTDRALRRVAIEPHTRAGKALRLTKPTFFYPANVLAMRPTSVELLSDRRCPPDVFARLKELVGL